MRDIIVIGAPVGGGATLVRLAAALPADLQASIFVVLHTTPENPILLSDVINAPGRMRASEAINGERIEPSRIYVACDGKHLVLDAERIRLTSEAEANSRRPSIDVLFRSAAASHKDRVVGVILLHAREEGIKGLHAIRQNGGKTITHRNDEMSENPRHPDTDENLGDDHLELQEIAPRLISYVHEANGNGSAIPQDGSR